MSATPSLFSLLRYRRARPVLPPLDTEGVLWVAALQLVPIEERIEWVAQMKAYVERINVERARG